MNNRMLPRGPDDAGVESMGVATLGMRRLSIFDPANGHQPMHTPDGRWHLVFNGAIYNFRALRSELASSHDFKTECDTEVLLAAIGRWGRGALPRLRGMFAFAAWDSTERTLLIARDTFGIKPLYFHTTAAGELLFASELNALLASGRVPAQIDPQGISDYLSWLSVPAPRTIYQNVFSLRGGECAEWREGRLSIATYDGPRELLNPTRAITPAKSREAFISGLREKLEDTVSAHSIADVPVGAFLSGGLDSTALVALMVRQGGSRLKTFSIGFDDAGYSEADEAAANARHLGTAHHATVLTGERLAGDIGTLIHALDQPTGDGLNTYYASQAAKAGGVTVAVSGLGSDELLGGYPSFNNVPRISRWLPAWNVLPRSLRNTLLGRLAKGDTRSRKLGDSLRYGATPAALALLQRRVLAESTRRSLLTPDLAQDYAAHPAESSLAGELHGSDLFTISSFAELKGYMTDVLLRDSDVMSMANSLELRVPFVDRPFAEWVLNQPSRFKYTPASPKSALAEAVSDLLPPGMLNRKKRGFTLPYAVWMRGPLKPFLEETFTASSVAQSGMFDTTAVQAQWMRFLAGNDSIEWSRIWSLAILVAFINRPRPASL